MRRIQPTPSGLTQHGHNNATRHNNTHTPNISGLEPISTLPTSPSIVDSDTDVLVIDSEPSTSRSMDGDTTMGSDFSGDPSVRVDIALPILYGGKVSQSKMTVAKAVATFNKFWIQAKDWPPATSLPVKNLALPWLSDSLFNQHLGQIGAVALWESQHKHIEKNDAAIASIKRSLSRMAKSPKWSGQYLSIYLAQYSMQAKGLAYEVYELGLGHLIAQSLVPDSFEKRVYSIIGRSQSHGSSACNILPFISGQDRNDILYQHVDYVLFEESSIPKMSLNTLIPYSKKMMYFAKLECGLTCLRRHRYPEAWAHFLSALDFCEMGFPLQSRLMDWLGEIACVLHLPMHVCYFALRQSTLASKSFDDHWHRWQIFHHMCCVLGLFDLAQEVYLRHVDFPNDSSFEYWFKRQHIEAMMLHIEDNLLFQYARFTFHQTCSEQCERPFNYNYSFPNVSKMIASLEPIIVSLKNSKEKDYYWGLIFFYKSMVAVGFMGNYLDTQGEHYLVLSRTFLSASSEGLSECVNCSDPRKIMSLHMSLLLEPQFFKLKATKQDFDIQTLTPYSLDKAEYFFRVTLFILYWQIKFPTFRLKLMLAETMRCYSELSQPRIHYRIGLLKSLLRTMDTNHRHQASSILRNDFPNPQAIFKSPLLEVTNRMTATWQREIKHYSAPMTPRKIRVMNSSKDLFREASSGEKFYALGYHTVEYRTNT